MRSIINIGGSGNCAFPGPNNSPRAHFNKSSRSKLDGYGDIVSLSFLNVLRSLTSTALILQVFSLVSRALNDEKN